MAKSSNKTTASKSKAGSKGQSHVYRGVRDIILNDARSTTVSTLTTNSTGAALVGGAIVPMVITAVQVIAGGTSGAMDAVVYPRCSWLTSTAKNFQSYRVLRASLVFIGNAGSTTSGTVNLFGSRDILDVATSMQTAYVIGKDAKSFDLASSSNKELKLSIPVDSTWKKVSSELTVLGNNGFSGTQYSVVPVNSLNDLIAGGFMVQVVGAPASANVGNAFIDYDVEFRDPISVALNL